MYRLATIQRLKLVKDPDTVFLSRLPALGVQGLNDNVSLSHRDSNMKMTFE